MNYVVCICVYGRIDVRVVPIPIHWSAADPFDVISTIVPAGAEHSKELRRQPLDLDSCGKWKGRLSLVPTPPIPQGHLNSTLSALALHLPSSFKQLLILNIPLEDPLVLENIA